MNFTKILIDMSNIYHRNYNVYKDMTHKVYGKEIMVGGIYGTLKSIEAIERNYKGTNAILYYLYDNNTSKDKLRDQMDTHYMERKYIDPEYKLNRSLREPAFYKGLDLLKLMLECRQDNCVSIRVTGYEADDLVKPVLEEVNSIDPHGRKLIVSEDMDWARVINNNTFWLAKKRIWTPKDFEDHYGFKVEGKSVALYKSIRGDSSDNIPAGIPRIREDKVLRIVNEFKDVYDFLANYQNLGYLTDKWKKIINEQASRLRLNHQLVDFIDVSKENIDNGTNVCYSHTTKYKQLLNVLGFDLNEFMGEGYTNLIKKDNGVIDPLDPFSQPTLERY